MIQQSYKFYYELTKDIFYKKFPSYVLSDFPNSNSIFVNGRMYFGDLCNSVLLYFDGKKLLYPHHLDITQSNIYPYNYIIEPFTKNNKPTNTLTNFMCDYTPTSIKLESICNNMLSEINRMKEYYKLKQIEKDF